MSAPSKLPTFLFAALLAVTLVGCSQDSAVPKEGGKSAPADATAAGTMTDAAAGDASGLAELSAADRQAAEKQKVCPVTGEALGSMGAPYKMTVKGRVIFLCCDGCKDKVEKDPDKYLKKLDELAAAEKK